MMGNIKSVYAVLRMGNEDSQAICVFKQNADKLVDELVTDGFDSWVEECTVWECRYNGEA